MRVDRGVGGSPSDVACIQIWVTTQNSPLAPYKVVTLCKHKAPTAYKHSLHLCGRQGVGMMQTGALGPDLNCLDVFKRTPIALGHPGTKLIYHKMKRSVGCSARWSCQFCGTTRPVVTVVLDCNLLPCVSEIHPDHSIPSIGFRVIILLVSCLSLERNNNVSSPLNDPSSL